jgi:hypothetical protein
MALSLLFDLVHKRDTAKIPNEMNIQGQSARPWIVEVGFPFVKALETVHHAPIVAILAG